MVCHDPVATGENADRKRIIGAEWHMSDKSAEDTNARWFADPERGWERAEERHELHQKGSKQSAKKKSEGSKGKITRGAWDY